ncbi:hypothetical protein SB764_41970, partial [Paraburkholderia sp. SIMBA_027]
MGAKIAYSRRGKECVGCRMGYAIAVGMAGKALLALPKESAQPQRLRVFRGRKRMDIDANARAGQRQVRWGV